MVNKYCMLTTNSREASFIVLSFSGIPGCSSEQEL